MTVEERRIGIGNVSERFLTENGKDVDFDNSWAWPWQPALAGCNHVVALTTTQATMHISAVALLSGALLLARSCLGQANCTGNITVYDDRDIEPFRENCPVIDGYIRFATNWTGDVNLDGVEIIRGDVWHSNCSNGLFYTSDECDNMGASPEFFKFSSSTLREIHGTLAFRWSQRLSQLMLPDLRLITGKLFLDDVIGLTELDLTRLEYLGDFEIDAGNLEKLHFNGLKGLWPWNPGWALDYRIKTMGKVDSVDGFYQRAFDTMSTNYSLYNGLEFDRFGNLDNINLGWTRIPSLSVLAYGDWPTRGHVLSMTLGGSETESMTIGDFWLDGRVHVERGREMRNLTVDEVYLENTKLLNISLPFDQLSYLECHGHGFHEPDFIHLPAQAVDWHNVTFNISGGHFLTFSSQYDAAGQQTWYWPMEIRTLHMEANMSMEFFETFLEQKTKVYDSVFIEDISGRVNCTVLENHNNQGPVGSRANFTCIAHEPESGAILRGINWHLQVGLFVLITLCLLS
ncbi:hypothetical protein HJFPF1_07653 [Paramyrothecium foliicola]|nr:hypothetical protein HJFPF1_07653 [Paramyrothecium foliicola]